MYKIKEREKVKLRDPIFNKKLINILIKSVLKNGRRTILNKLFYQICKNIKFYFKKNPVLFFFIFVNRCTFGFRLKKHKIKKKFYDVPTVIDCHEIAFKNAFKLLFVVSYYKRKRERKNLIHKILIELYYSLYLKRNSLFLKSLYMMIRDVKYNKNFKSYKWRKKKK